MVVEEVGWGGGGWRLTYQLARCWQAHRRGWGVGTRVDTVGWRVGTRVCTGVGWRVGTRVGNGVGNGVGWRECGHQGQHSRGQKSAGMGLHRLLEAELTEEGVAHIRTRPEQQ